MVTINPSEHNYTNQTFYLVIRRIKGDSLPDFLDGNDDEQEETYFDVSVVKYAY